MAKHGKKYEAAQAKVDLNKEYSPRDAVALAKETSITKFDSTVEVHMRTALDPRQADQQVRDVVVLPHGLGKTVRVLVFAQGEGAAAARSAGADLVADVSPADLAARRDQHHPERGIVGGEAVRHQRGIARFEDPQRQLLAGQHRHLQREHRRDQHL